MNKHFTIFVSAIALLSAVACMPVAPRPNEAYWQRVEDNSALRMKGPKAQQRLEENIAACVREIDELVELDALRKTTPPDTHAEYHQALDGSGDLAYFDTPTRYKVKMVDHSDFHDFEGCMRHAGWERVKYVRYQTARQSQDTYKATQQFRTYGVTGHAAEAIQQAEKDALTEDYKTTNE